MILALVVGVGGGLGAVLRYVTDGAVQRRHSGTFPAGTIVVNVAGSLVLGFLVGMAWYHGMGGRTGAVLGTGLCGGLTTWSTASWESVRMIEQGQFRAAFVFTLGSLALAIAAAAAGVALAAA